MNEAAGSYSTIETPSSATGDQCSSIHVERVRACDRLKVEGPLFALASAVVVVSFLLPALRSRHMWISAPCVFHKVTRVPCFMCGMTRSFVFTAHGNLHRAFEMHLLGPLLFLVACGLVAYLGSVLAFGYRIKYRLAPRTRRIAFWSALGILLICWGIKIAFIRSGW
ncbi:MAG: hypothetical protein CVT63_01315 [Candidatus Anoxymicrobium japonicum]|uniref:DUF2752 domain-containing protein n=1 Tax=Candidatus Anoxymicrobium japonicum TaxID=2013648 RepID=A0A2N3G7M2_9ACTN|nr:MAG: hypothetical protein CVT63_01315 [Candidatus Anoxymicrobium japonicum]